MKHGLLSWRMALRPSPTKNGFQHWRAPGDGLMSKRWRLGLASGRSIVVFLWDNQAWQKGWVIDPLEEYPKQRKAAQRLPALPLLLKGRRYATLVKAAGKSWPVEWSDTLLNSRPASNLRGAGKGTASLKSWVPSTPKTCRSKDSDSLKSWVPKSPKSCKSCKSQSALPAKASASTLTDVTGELLPTRTRVSAGRLREVAAEDKNSKKFEWPCPKCKIIISANTKASMIGMKHYHWRTRHPECPKEQVCQPPPQVYETSEDIPVEQQDWKCPLCPAALSMLPKQDRLRAIRKHAADRHPGETVSSLNRRIQKGRKKPEGFAKKIQEQWLRKKSKAFPTHSVVCLNSLEVQSAQGAKSAQDSAICMCSVCLTIIGKPRKAKERGTCKQRQRKLKTCPQYYQRRKAWWKNLRENRPEIAAQAATVLHRSLDELDQIFGRFQVAKGAARWQKTKVANRQAA